MGAQVTVCGPPTLIPREVESLGCEVRYDLDDVAAADVVYALRMQNERMGGRPSCPRCASTSPATRSTAAGCNPRQLLMHPGPVNRGVELSAEVIESPQALIVDQVAAGLVVRMAILYELLSAAATTARRPARRSHGGAAGVSAQRFPRVRLTARRAGPGRRC